MAPETRYALSGKVNIAYQVIGDGPLDLVYVPGWVSHVELAWEEPLHASFLHRLASFSRLITFDKRGTGLSDRVSDGQLPTLEKRMDDLRAVMDAVRSERAAVFGVSEGGNMSILFAATHPERRRRSSPSAAEDLEDLRERGVSIVVTLMPALDGKGELGQWSAATIEAVFAALCPDPAVPLSEDVYLDLMANLEWTPAIRYLRPDEAGIHKFAFVIHPLSVKFIRQNKWLRWTKLLPDSLVETAIAYLPPLYLSRITGGQSPATGQRIEGYLYTLGATPRRMMQNGERFTYSRLNKAARMAERKGARIMGLGAFTSVVGDAGITVANESDIAITSGNSLTVAATLEAAKQAVIQMGATLRGSGCPTLELREECQASPM